MKTLLINILSQEAQSYMVYGLLALFVIAALIVGRNVWVGVKNKKKWLKNIKVNDKCHYNFVGENYLDDMWISKILDDGKVEVTFRGSERFLFPPTKRRK